MSQYAVIPVGMLLLKHGPPVLSALPNIPVIIHPCRKLLIWK